MKGDKIQLTRGMYESMGLPSNFWHVGWDKVADNDDKKVIEKYLSKRFTVSECEHDGLFLTGPSSSGKSYLSAFVASVFKSHSFSVQWMAAKDIQNLCVNGVDCVDCECTWFDRFRSVDVLVVDGLGSEIVKSISQNFVLDILYYRRDWAKISVINSRVDLLGLSNQYADDGFAKMIAGSMPVIVLTGNYVNDDCSKIQNRYF